MLELQRRLTASLEAVAGEKKEGLRDHLEGVVKKQRSALKSTLDYSSLGAQRQAGEKANKPKTQYQSLFFIFYSRPVWETAAKWLNS